MDVNDLKGLYAESNKRMNTALEHVKHELAGVRTGRASVTMLDGIHVEAYGAKMPLAPPPTGEPGKAPASKAMYASPATSVPSFLAPSFTRT